MSVIITYLQDYGGTPYVIYDTKIGKGQLTHDGCSWMSDVDRPRSAVSSVFLFRRPSLCTHNYNVELCTATNNHFPAPTPFMMRRNLVGREQTSLSSHLSFCLHPSNCATGRTGCRVP